MPCVLPVDHVIHNRPLFRGRLAEIDARGLDAFMSHEIGKKSNIVAALQKALCETVPERVRVDHSRVDVIAHGKLLELTGDASGRNPIPVLVQKNEAAFLFLFCQPGKGFILQCLGNVNPPELSTLGVEVNVSEANVFDLDLNQFAHSGTRCRKEADHKIPEHFAIALKAILEVGVISLADHIFQKCFLLHSHKGQLPFCFPDKLRVMFARISVSMLEPDLVIMDEFQRFKFLLSSDDSELGILAHSFLSGHDTRVLLLSATPYKLYSTLEEIDENQLDEHYAEFFQVMNFLFDDEVKDTSFKEIWKNYSVALSELKAGDSAIIRMKELAENAMYQGVSRTERISVMDSGDYTDDSSVKHHLRIDGNDINSYIQMSRLLSRTDSKHTLPVDYAKSCPYLMSFMKKYKIKEQIEKYYTKHPDEFGNEREQNLLWLNRNKINKYDELPKTNARLEALKEKAFTGGAEKYLWIPPSMPYYEMQGAYKNSKGFSKILVFSAWEMVPRMIGAMVSYEAERLTVGKLVHQIKNQDKKNTGYFAEGSRRYPVARLRFNVSNGEVRGMSLFALLYPSKTLSDMYLPIESLNNHESLEVIEKSIRLKLNEKLAVIDAKYGDSSSITVIN